MSDSINKWVLIVKVDSNMKLGEWAGLCKIDQEGKARKVPYRTVPTSTVTYLTPLCSLLLLVLASATVPIIFGT